jgi:CHASE2 domain-containing sensor protein
MTSSAGPDSRDTAAAERIIRWIMAGIVVWGVFHGIGAWRLNHDPRRLLVVLACVAAFLGFWLAMLAARRRRLSR